MIFSFWTLRISQKPEFCNEWICWKLFYDSKNKMTCFKILNCFLRSVFFKKCFEKFQNWPKSRYESGISHRFHKFSQFVKLRRSVKIYCVVSWCMLKNRIVLCCEIVIFHNHSFTIWNGQFHKLTILFYNSVPGVTFLSPFLRTHPWPDLQ